MNIAGSPPEIRHIDKASKAADEVKPGNPVDHPLGIPSGVVMATIQDDDERMLARIGYRQACFPPPPLPRLSPPPLNSRPFISLAVSA